MMLFCQVFWNRITAMEFDIWVDADSVPVNLRQIILKASSRLDIRCQFVADRELPDVKRHMADETFSLRQRARESGMSDEARLKAIRTKVSMVVVSTGSNSADDYIVENAGTTSLCITHDIPLAARLLDKGCTVIDDRGREYSDSDIKVRLGDRLVNQELRSWGVFAEQQKKMGGADVKAFADNFDRTLTRLARV